MEIATIQHEISTRHYIKCPPQKRTIILDWIINESIEKSLIKSIEKSLINKFNGREYFFLQFPELIFEIETDFNYRRTNPDGTKAIVDMYLYGIPYLSNVGSNGSICLGKNCSYKKFNNQTEFIHHWISYFWNTPFFVRSTSNLFPIEYFLDYYNQWQNLKRPPDKHKLAFKPIITPNLNNLSFEPLKDKI